MSPRATLALLGLLCACVPCCRAIQNCAVWEQIAPCTCKDEGFQTTVTCVGVNSFEEIANLLRGKFENTKHMAITIANSTLYDLPTRSFQELSPNLEKLQLNFINVDINELEELSFSGLTKVTYLNLADNSLPEVPEHIFSQMPNIKTLDLGRTKLRHISDSSFKYLPYLETLTLCANHLTHLDRRSFPTTLIRLHVGHNHLQELNGALRNLTNLSWFFVNQNELSSLDGELPRYADKLTFVYASHNRIRKLPHEFKNYPQLESLFFQHNLLTKFDGVLGKSKKLTRIQFEHNRINTLTPNDFAETQNLSVVMLGYNHISSFNGSLRPLKQLRYLNVSHNLFTEFNVQEITGLVNLSYIDLSHNRLTHIIGLPPNLIEWETGIKNLYLHHNSLSNLNGSLSGLRNLEKLYLSHNKITKILPDDLIGLDHLQMLDISYNHLTTLEEMGKTFLPNLEELIAHHNFLTSLERDFHGLPILCWADLSNNQIVSLSHELVSKTHCKVKTLHEPTFGTLKIYLKDNPILCDAALQEIMAEYEVNHTKISGNSRCPPISELSTPRPHTYLDYSPDVNTHPLPIPTYIQSHVEPPNQTPQRQTYIHESIADNNLNNRVYDAPIVNINEQHRPKIEKQYFVPIHQNQYNGPLENGNTKSNILNPVPNLSERLTIPITISNHPEQPIRMRSATPVDVKTETEINQQEQDIDQVAFQRIYPILQEKQMNQFATQIEELRTKVEELVEQNQQLVQNLNQILPNKTLGGMNANSLDVQAQPTLVASNETTIQELPQ